MEHFLERSTFLSTVLLPWRWVTADKGLYRQEEGEGAGEGD